MKLADISYTDLYERWERNQWQATDLDFTDDRRDWQSKLSDVQRRAAIWNYSMFFHGEDAVATDLAPFITAAPTEEARYFLATQQADEARHAVFFARFFADVVDFDRSVSSALSQSEKHLSWGFVQVFRLLDDLTDLLRRRPTLENLAAAVAMYHIVVEGTLAQPGQRFIQGYLERERVLPAFAEGMSRVAHDEHRHIAFGVKLLSELITDPRARAAAASTVQRALAFSAGVFVAPNPEYLSCFGGTPAEIYAHGLQSLETKLRVIGFTGQEVQAITGFDAGMPVSERVATALALLDGDLIGERRGAPSSDPELLGAFFEVFANVIGPQRQPITVLWEFHEGISAWVRLGDRVSSGVGSRADADVKIRAPLSVWLDLTQARVPLWRAVLSRQLTVAGSPRKVAAFGGLLSQRAPHAGRAHRQPRPLACG